MDDVKCALSAFVVAVFLGACIGLFGATVMGIVKLAAWMFGINL